MFWGIVCLLLFGLFPIKSFGNHILGSHITFTCDSSKSYTFQFKYYVDCGGIALTTSKIFPKLRQLNGSGSSSITLKLVSIKDVSSVCSIANRSCTGGAAIEEQTYEAKINFNTSPYNSLLGSGTYCDFIVETKICCQSLNLTTVVGTNDSSYAFTTFNVCLGATNSSPQFLGQLPFKMYCNNPVYSSVAAFDYIDNDSLSFKFGQPMARWNKPVQYQYSYTYLSPIKVYDPKGTGVINPNVKFPTGLYLDPLLGNLIFTPTACGQTTLCTFEVKEWRKDSSGTYKVISTTRREVIFEINSPVKNINDAPEVILNSPDTLKTTPCLIENGQCVSIYARGYKTSSSNYLTPTNYDLELPPGVSITTHISSSKESMSSTYCLDLTKINFANFVNKPLMIPVRVVYDGCKSSSVNQKTIGVYFDTSVQQAKIVGQIQNDTNLNCAFDNGESKLGVIRKIGIHGKSLYYVYSDENGQYKSCSDTGMHNIKIMPSPWYEELCDSIQQYVRKDSSYQLNFYSRLKRGIAGNVFLDKDSCQVIKSGVANQMLKITPGNKTVTTDENGFFLIQLDSSGTYTVQLLQDTSRYESRCFQTSQINFVAGKTIYTNNFLLFRKPIPDVKLAITYNTGNKLRRGSDCHAAIEVSNPGVQKFDTIIIYAKIQHSLVDSVKSSSGWDYLGSDLYSRKIANFSPGQIQRYYFYLNTKGLKTGDSLWSFVQCDSSILKVDLNPSNNQDSAKFIVVSPYDPNIKSSEPDSIFTVDNLEIKYTIQFQNEGTASALEVNVIDTLPQNLDPASLQILHSSHIYNYVIQDNIILFTFSDINLPPKKEDEAGSMGFISFSLKLRDEIKDAQYVKNRAGIYFDIEDVVLTNTAVNHFKSPIEFRDNSPRFYCAEDPINLPFYTNFQTNSGNTFILEMSDSSGSDTTFRGIDTISSSALSDTFVLNVPKFAITGDHYAFRIKSTDLNTIMFDSAYIRNIRIQRLNTSKLITTKNPICGDDVFSTSVSVNYAQNDFYVNDTLLAKTGGTFLSDSLKNGSLIYCLQTTSEGCHTHSDSVVVTVFSQPRLSFLSDSFFCVDSANVELALGISHSHGIGKSDTVEWNWGDGSIEHFSISDLRHSRSFTPGIQMLSFKSQNQICIDSFTQKIITKIHPAASFDIEFDKICEADSLLITNTSTVVFGNIAKLNFDLEDGTSDYDSLFKHQFPDSGNYQIKLIATDNFGCHDTSQKSVTVVKGPVAKIITDKPEACLVDALFNFSSEIRNPFLYRSWSYDGQKSADSSFQYKFSKTGSYVVNLFVKGVGSCSDSTVVNINVYPSEPAAFSIPDLMCNNNSLSVSADQINSGVTYHWKSAFKNVTHNSITLDGSWPLGNNELKLITETTHGCLDSISKFVVIVPKPQIKINSDSVCFPELSELINQSTALTDSTYFNLIWGDGSQQNNIPFAKSWNHSFSPGVYLGTLYAQTSICSDSAFFTKTVFDKPQAFYTIPDLMCNTHTVTVSPAPISSGLTYYWQSDFKNVTGNSITIDGSWPLGRNDLTLISETIHNCRNSITKSIVIIPKPRLDITSDSVCFPETSSIINQSIDITDSTFFNLTWGDGARQNNLPFANSWNHTFSPGSYPGTLYAQTSICSDSVSFTHVVYEKPEASFSVKSRNNEPLWLDISNSSQKADHHFWMFEESGNEEENNTPTFSHHYDLPAQHTIALRVTTDNGCWDTVSIGQYIVDRLHFLIPNAYSPNNDMLNDGFAIFPKEFIAEVDFVLIGRHGKTMVHSTDINNLINIDLPLGVYAYELRIKDIFGQDYFFSDRITVIK